MLKKTSTSLVISTYNAPRELLLVLKSIEKQYLKPNEVVVADDGSGEETKQVIASFCEKSNIKIIHVWHQDNGFQKAIILNKAIAKAQGEYIIQVDGDCFLHPKFVYDHVKNAKKSLFLYGTRVRIKESRKSYYLNTQKTEVSFFAKGLKKRMRNIYFPKLNTYKEELLLSPKFRGCNMSFWKSDCIKVNGYNEDFKGWGREDSEFAARLINAGIYSKRLKFEAIQYHLDHFENSKYNLDVNDLIQDKTLKNKLSTISNGINKYL